MLAFID